MSTNAVQEASWLVHAAAGNLHAGEGAGLLVHSSVAN